MQISLHGAANEVTGSSYQVQTARASVLVDFGAFQGSRGDDDRNIVPKTLDVNNLDAVVLTHGHLDHIGRLPLLAKRGFNRPVYATPGTIDLAGLILRDSAKIMEQEIDRINRKRERAGEDLLTAPFDLDDVERLLRQMRPLSYEKPTDIAPDISVRMHEAGHLLGSASVEMKAEGKTLIFSGDLGPKNMPILREPAVLKDADWVFMESTYGDRDHRSLPETMKEFAELVKRAVQRKGKILVPSFAIGRTQQILYHLAELFRDKVVPPFPIYVDSPMALTANDIYTKHPELYDDAMKAFVSNGDLAKTMDLVQASQSSDESKALNDVKGTCLILAGAGMCNAGRILHHLKHNLWRPETTVIFVGYQAPGSLGRNLVEGKNPVSIFGEKIAVNATIRSLGGFSAHAGQTDLCKWFSTLAPNKPRLTLAHGEERGRIPLARVIKERFGVIAELPAHTGPLPVG